MTQRRVGVVGATGRMGAEVCRAVLDAEGMDLVAAVDPAHGGRPLREAIGRPTDLAVAGDLDALTVAGVEVAVDFTHPDAVFDNVRWLLQHEVHAVVGTTGLGADQVDELRTLADAGTANALLAPNFAIGAILLMRFAQQAAKHLPHVEVIELHHDRKAESPSGTALRTAQLIAQARTEVPELAMGELLDGARGADVDGIRVHSLRLPGLVAHQEVVFGGPGQTLTIRHDSIDRSSFMPGVVLGIRGVAQLDGLVIGLEHLLDDV